jgi:prophage regulatory protein
MKILRLKQVIETTGLARSTIYKLIAAGTFPRQIALTENGKSSGWILGEVESWIRARVDARDAV